MISRRGATASVEGIGPHYSFCFSCPMPLDSSPEVDVTVSEPGCSKSASSYEGAFGCCILRRKTPDDYLSGTRPGSGDSGGGCSLSRKKPEDGGAEAIPLSCGCSLQNRAAQAGAGMYPSGFMKGSWCGRRSNPVWDAPAAGAWCWKAICGSAAAAAHLRSSIFAYGMG